MQKWNLSEKAGLPAFQMKGAGSLFFRCPVSQ